MGEIDSKFDLVLLSNIPGFIIIYIHTYLYNIIFRYKPLTADLIEIIYSIPANFYSSYKLLKKLLCMFNESQILNLTVNCIFLSKSFAILR